LVAIIADDRDQRKKARIGLGRQPEGWLYQSEKQREF